MPPPLQTVLGSGVTSCPRIPTPQRPAWHHPGRGLEWGSPRPRALGGEPFFPMKWDWGWESREGHSTLASTGPGDLPQVPRCAPSQRPPPARGRGGAAAHTDPPASRTTGLWMGTVSPPLLPFGGEKAKLESGRWGEALVQRRARGDRARTCCGRLPVAFFRGKVESFHETPGGVRIHVRLWAGIWGQRGSHLPPGCSARLARDRKSVV